MVTAMAGIRDGVHGASAELGRGRVRREWASVKGYGHGVGGGMVLLKELLFRAKSFVSWPGNTEQMRFLFLAISFILAGPADSQDTIPVSKIDSPINFFDQRPLRLADYNNRVIPFDNLVPLYVEITYEKSNRRNFEYFRIDSSHYLRYEYFRSDKGSSNDGIKSYGAMRVTNDIAGVDTTGVRHVGIRHPYDTREIHHYRAFSKEGQWEEFEDSLFNHVYWEGSYRNNKRIGLWKKMVYGIGEDYVLEEIDYDKNPSKRIDTANIAGTISVDTLNHLLMGVWNLRGCDAINERRMFYSKCPLSGERPGGDCADDVASGSHYTFGPITKFSRIRGETCNRFREDSINGEWQAKEEDGDWLIILKFPNRPTWRLKILYLGRDGNLVTDRK